ncbi:YqjK family protein [Zoogloea sp.]|uniref:YqjK family protein n=1 Tax=Zoogloea sp. TaxID=49181 RepID=UPI001A3C7CF5|nr:hypothetical protein [Zoogloea sp.]
MKPELVELALRKQRLQARCGAQREALIHHAQAFTPLFRGVDRVVNGVLWARDKAPILSGLAIVVVLVRPRAALRWARRAWMGWQLLRRARTLIP